MDFEEIKRRLSLLDTACICDANKDLRAIDPAIRPISTGLKLIGRAHTVTCHEDFLTVIKALRDAEQDEVLVIDSQGSRRALTGELFPTEAIRKQLASSSTVPAGIRQKYAPYLFRIMPVQSIPLPVPLPRYSRHKYQSGVEA